MRTASSRHPADSPSTPGAAARSPGTSRRRRLVYLETLDPLYDRDGGLGRMLYRVRRDFPWVLTEGWELERWGVWRAGHQPPGAGTVRGPRLPAWVPPHPSLAVLAWMVHLALALTRPGRGVVVAYNPFAALGVALARLLGRSPPLVVRVIGNISSKALAVHRSPRRARLLAAVEGFALRKADLAVPMGAYTRDLARRAGAPDDRIVELPHPPRWFRPDPSHPPPSRSSISPPAGPAALPGASQDRSSGLPTEVSGGDGDVDGPVRIVAAGRFVTSKGFDVLLRAFAVLAGEVDDVVLELAGDGPERARLEELATELGLKQRIRFHGWLPAGRMPDFFAGALVSVLPSRVEEGLGMVLVEAGMAGCALVGSDLGGIRDIVRPADSGVLVPPEDPVAMAEALRRLLDDRDEARRLGAGARAAALVYVGAREAALRELRQRFDELHPQSVSQHVENAR